MAWAYSALLDPADVRRAERLEPLDELEEWHLFMQHYMLALGVREAEGREGLLGKVTLIPIGGISACPQGGGVRTAKDLPKAMPGWGPSGL